MGDHKRRIELQTDVQSIQIRLECLRFALSYAQAMAPHLAQDGQVDILPLAQRFTDFVMPARGAVVVPAGVKIGGVPIE